MMRVKSAATFVAYSDGLNTTVQPAASAGATFCANCITGALKGVIAATTPTGSLTVNSWLLISSA